jgi:hypothetical protein
MSLYRGTKFGPYEILDPLGAGGTDFSQSGVTVAVKDANPGPPNTSIGFWSSSQSFIRRHDHYCGRKWEMRRI